MAELQRRLAALGYTISHEAESVFGKPTHVAVTEFQAARGLRTDGVCGHQTWSAIVEAGYQLGDRRLHQRRPMMRGDDVADLQRRLGGLGFDAGKVDGIFGPETASALADFQRNVGLIVDGIFGGREMQVIERLAHHGGDGLVTDLREVEALRSSARSLERLRVVVGARCALDSPASALGRALQDHGAEAIVVEHPDGSERAQQANRARAALFLEVSALHDVAGCRCAYYRGYSTSSPAGHDLAERLQLTVSEALAIPALGACGMAVPVLRETRMPAVICEVGPADRLMQGAPALAGAVVDALVAWMAPIS